MVSRRNKGIASSVSNWMDHDDHVQHGEVDTHLRNAWDKTGKGLRKHIYTGGPIRRFLRKRAVVTMAQHQVDGVEQRDVSRSEVKKRFKTLRKSGEMREMKKVDINDLVMEVARNEFQSPRSANDKKRLANNKASMKKYSTDHKDPVTADDKNFKASNIKTYDRTPMHGYNPGDDVRVNEDMDPYREKKNKARNISDRGGALENRFNRATNRFVGKKAKKSEISGKTNRFVSRIADPKKWHRAKIKEEMVIEGASAYSKMSVSELRRLRAEAADHLAKNNSPAIRSKLASIKHHLKRKGVNEEALNELSKKTLGSYVKKATKSSEELMTKSKEYGDKYTKSGKTKDRSEFVKNLFKSGSRDNYIKKAKSKLTKEEIEIEEGILSNIKHRLPLTAKKGLGSRRSEVNAKLKIHGDNLVGKGAELHTKAGSSYSPKKAHDLIGKGFSDMRKTALADKSNLMTGVDSKITKMKKKAKEDVGKWMKAGADKHKSSINEETQNEDSKEVYNRHHKGAMDALKDMLNHLKDHGDFLNKHEKSSGSKVIHNPHSIKDVHRRIEDMRDDVKSRFATKDNDSMDNNSIGTPQDYSTAQKVNPRMEKIKRYISSNKRGMY